MLAGGVEIDLTCHRLLEMLDGQSLVNLSHSPSADSAGVTVPTWQVSKTDAQSGRKSSNCENHQAAESGL